MNNLRPDSWVRDAMVVMWAIAVILTLAIVALLINPPVGAGPA